MSKDIQKLTISIDKQLFDAIEKLATSFREYDNELCFPEYRSRSQCYEDLLRRGYEEKKKEDKEREMQWSKMQKEKGN
jgi:metal-responsive CopG/Arc/MetJ family transcriptional regulator